MGQSPSRLYRARRDTRSTPTTDPAAANASNALNGSESVDNAQSGESGVAPQTRASAQLTQDAALSSTSSHKRSKRRILSIVRPRSSSTASDPKVTEVDGHEERPPPASLRKRWRASRRSMPPPALNEEVDTRRERPASAIEGRDFENAARPAIVHKISATSVKGKGKGKARDNGVDGVEEETEGSTSSEPMAGSSVTNADSEGPAPSTSGASPAADGPSQQDTAQEASSDTNAPPNTEDSQASQGRHFPPAGTLVVVQGVVHTTDVPRSSESGPPTIAQPTPPPGSASPAPSVSTFGTPATPASAAVGRSASTSRASNSSPRNRLSALISRSRPASMLSTRTSTHSDAHSAVVASQGPSEGDTSADTSSGVDSSAPQEDSSATSVSVGEAARAEQTSTSVPQTQNESSGANAASQPAPSQDQNQNAGNASAQHQTGNDSASRHAPLSPGSIEVLGTLLSVAAAATAASLVTGSSDPLFNSGLALPHASVPGLGTNANPDANMASPPSSPSPPPFGSDRPTSPTPTSGLGLGSGRERERERRMSRPWGSLRERLGLGGLNSRTGGGAELGSAPPDVLSGGDAALGNAMGDGAGDANGDPRQRMLREMARALSMGLGLNNGTRNPAFGGGAGGESETANRASSPTGTEGGRLSGASGEERTQLPPENSFERFLIDLQADLRVALTEHDADSEHEDAEDEETAAPRDGSDDAEGQDSPTGLGLVNLFATEEENAAAEANANRADADSPPPLADVSDSSESEDEDDEQGDDSDSEDMHTAQENEIPAVVVQSPSNDDAEAPSTAPEPSPPAQQETRPQPFTSNVDGHTTRRPGGGINWWRLYRFPPMPLPPNGLGVNRPVPSTVGGVPATSATPAAATAATASESAPSMETPAQPASTEGRSTTPAPPTTEGFIVPVIVVGLQSVNTDLGRNNFGAAQGPAGPADDGVPASPTTDERATGNRPDTPAVDDASQAENGSGARGRTWHTRAANALRGLRYGRRGASDAARPNQNTGSRTFMIYVIGGYYPPNHHMVTGTDNLDSFEALLELAELVGQVKPPTATKEEIEKSGLEVFKSSELAEYEREGRVASNCTDRCLICLDDYDPEDDMRLMSCKHAFHKDCVDKWLSTGRNNCPACRTKGVSTSNDAPPPEPETPVPPPLV